MKKVTINNNSNINNPIPNMIPPTNVPEFENHNVIDVEPTEIKNAENNISVVTEETPIPKAIEEKEEYIIAKTATPFNTSVIEAYGKHVATIYFLCKNKDNNLFVLMRNYILDSEEEILSIQALPFAQDDDIDFASRKIVNNMLNTCLDTYVIDMKFHVDEGFDKIANPDVWLEANKLSTKEEVKIKMTADIFSCIAFIDSYIFEGIDNEHDLTLATVAGSKVIDSSVDFFIVDKIESIVSMAPAEVKVKRKGLAKLFGLKKVKYDTTLGIVLKVSKYINNNEREVAQILTPFDVGVQFDESKFRGNTIDNIQDKYYGDSDQFVGTLMITNIRLYGIDKEYMIIRGKTKDKKVRLFLFDSSTQQELRHLIDTY